MIKRDRWDILQETRWALGGYECYGAGFDFLRGKRALRNPLWVMHIQGALHFRNFEECGAPQSFVELAIINRSFNPHDTDFYVALVCKWRPQCFYLMLKRAFSDVEDVY